MTENQKTDSKKAVPVNQQPMSESQEALVNALGGYLKTVPQDSFFKYLGKYLNDKDGPSIQERVAIIKIVCNSTKTPVPQNFIEILFNELDNFTRIVNPTLQYLDTIKSIFGKLGEIVTDRKDKNRLLRKACSYLKGNSIANPAQSAALSTINDYIITL